jgi:hypothetical protein
MWLMEEASMMSVMNGWSSIRIPVNRCEQREHQVSGDMRVEKSLGPGYSRKS